MRRESDEKLVRLESFGDLVRMQRKLRGSKKLTVWSLKSLSGKMNVIRLGAPVIAIPIWMKTVLDGDTGFAISFVAGAVAITSLVQFILANTLLSLRTTVIADWIIRLGKGDLDHRVSLYGNDQFAWMSKALDRIRERSIREVRLPLATQLADDLEARNHELEQALGELQRSQDQIIAQQKSVELGELAAGVAHEVRNPLNFIHNFAEATIALLGEREEIQTAKSDRRTTEEAKQNLERITRGTHRANLTIERVLSLARPKGKPESCELNEIVMHHARLAVQAGSRTTRLAIELETDFDPDIGAPVVIQQGIARVIVNLVSNACDAIEERARESEEDYKPRITIGTRREEDRIRIEIVDNGAGMAPQVRMEATRPFFTTKSPERGVGLGLGQCEDIVREHEGEMRIESSTESKTTRVTTWFTDASRPVPRPTTVPPPMPGE